MPADSPITRAAVQDVRTMREVRQALQAHQDSDDLLLTTLRDNHAKTDRTLGRLAWLGIGTLATALVELVVRFWPHV